MLPRMEEKKVVLWMVSKREDLESSVAMGEREVASSGTGERGCLVWCVLS